MDAEIEMEAALQQVLVHAGNAEITVRTLILLVVLAALGALFYLVAKKAYHTYLLDRFYRDYRIELRRSVGIRRRRNSGINNFRLSFPVWLHHNKDGSQDRRRTGNMIKRGSCVLFVDSYRISCNSPMHLVWLVKALRAKGVSIGRCAEEERKYRDLMSRNALLQQRETILSLIDEFRERPTEFENYCSRVFDLNGFKSVVTPPSRDGGYDIELWKSSCLVGVVECKCYDPDNKIGRALVQKLVGANATLHAPRMIFVTTSDFTPDAQEYAENTGVELVNGRDLLRMARASAAGGLKEPTAEEYGLVREDLLQYYPPDFPPERFEV